MFWFITWNSGGREKGKGREKRRKEKNKREREEFAMILVILVAVSGVTIKIPPLFYLLYLEVKNEIREGTSFSGRGND